MRSMLLLLAFFCTVAPALAQNQKQQFLKLIREDALTVQACETAECEKVRDWGKQCFVPPPDQRPADCPARAVELLQHARTGLVDIGKGSTRVAASSQALVPALDIPRPIDDAAKTDPAAFKCVLDLQALWHMSPPARLEIGTTAEDAQRRGPGCARPPEKIVVELDKALDADCAASGAACEQGFKDAVGVATLANRIEYLLRYFQRLADGGLSGYYTFLDTKWTNYFSATRDQWPWELWINSRRFKSDGLQGFREPPDSQVIVFHPAVGYEYAAGKFEESLQLELFGRYWWEWSREGTVTRPKGVSVTLNFSGRSGASRTGLGFLYHLKKGASVGLSTRKEDEGGRLTSILFSYDLGKTVQDDVKTIREFVEKVR